MDHVVLAGARHGPQVHWRHAAVRALVEAAVLRWRRRGWRGGIFIRSLAYKTRALLSPPPAAIDPPPRHPCRRRRAAPLPASHGEASVHVPSVDPLEPSGATCSGRARVVAGVAPPRLPPPAPVVCPRRRDLHPNTGHPQALGEPTDVPRHFPGRERSRLAGIWPAPPPPTDKGRIASPLLILGFFCELGVCS
jgi:hypothetical protein